jgi:uncharacterized protein
MQNTHHKNSLLNSEQVNLKNHLIDLNIVGEKQITNHVSKRQKILKLFTLISRCSTYFLIYTIILYRFCISPILPQSCIFSPTCSEYALQALGRYNVFKACFLIVKRLLKCHALYRGNYHDPVP